VPLADNGTDGVEVMETPALDAAFRTLMDASRDPVLVLDTDLRVVTCNQPFARTFELLHDRPVRPGDEIAAIARPDLRRQLIDGALRVLSGASAEGVIEVQDRAGCLRTLEYANHPIRDRSGRITGVLHTARDITRRRMAEEEAESLRRDLESRVGERTAELEATAAALAEREAEYRALFDSAAVGQVQATPDGRFLRTNERFCRMVGYGPQELTTRGFDDITHPDDRERQARELGSILVGDREVWRSERRFVRKDGGVIWAELFIRLVRSPDGEPLRMIAVISDITDRRETEEALRRANLEKGALVAQLETLLQEAPIGFAFFDRAGRYVRVNPFIAAVNDLPAIDHVGLRPSEVLGPNGQRVEEIVAEVAATGLSVENEEFSGPCGPGHDRMMTFLVSFFPVFADGRVITVGSMVVDITEQKRHAERLRLLLAELDHRVKNTLAKVQSLITQTKAQAGSAEEFADALEGRVRSMARAHGALIRGHWEGAQLRPLVQDELAPYQSPGGTNAVINGPDLALRPAAALALGLALHELATNAAKYGALSAADGRVTVRWALAPDGGIDLVWEEAGGPPVGEPKRKGFGTLLVERSLSYELGGTTSLEFRPSGLVFRVAIPAEQLVLDVPTPPAGPLPGPEQMISEPAAGIDARRILIVEDSALIALDLQMTVERQGWTAVGPVGRLDKAMDLIGRERIDGAILDVNLDGTDSFPLADELRNRGIPFVFSTGYDRASMMPERFRDAPTLQKPFAGDALRRILLSTFG